MAEAAKALRIEVIRAWARTHRAVTLTLPAGSRVGDAVAASGLDDGSVAGMAVYGERVPPEHALEDGDRIELLAALVADPKEARRRRAGNKR